MTPIPASSKSPNGPWGGRFLDSCRTISAGPSRHGRGTISPDSCDEGIWWGRPEKTRFFRDWFVKQLPFFKICRKSGTQLRRKNQQERAATASAIRYVLHLRCFKFKLLTSHEMNCLLSWVVTTDLHSSAFWNALLTKSIDLIQCCTAPSISYAWLQIAINRICCNSCGCLLISIAPSLAKDSLITSVQHDVSYVSWKSLRHPKNLVGYVAAMCSMSCRHRRPKGLSMDQCLSWRVPPQKAKQFTLEKARVLHK